MDYKFWFSNWQQIHELKFVVKLCVCVFLFESAMQKHIFDASNLLWLNVVTVAVNYILFLYVFHITLLYFRCILG